MSKILKLEMKKLNVKGYIKGFLIANIVIAAFLLLIILDAKANNEMVAKDYTEAFQLVNIFAGMTFIVYTSVLLARTVIEEYKNKTITLLFMYPISRKKLMFGKLIIAASFTFLTTVLSDIFLQFFLCTVNKFYSFIPGLLTTDMILKSLLNILMYALTTSGMGLIPVFFGMLKKSVPVTIVTSIIIVSTVYSSNGGQSLSNIIIIPILLALIGVFIAYLSFRNIEHIDVK